MESLRVLIVDDSVTDAKLVARELLHTGRSVDFDRVDTAAAMRAALEREPWDVVISDSSMPKFSARAALELLKEMELDYPFIIVSGTIGEDMAVDAMRAGAHDYVLKDRLARLSPAVEREIRESRNREGRRQSSRALVASDARYRRIVETSNQGIWMIDLEGETTFMNARMASMLGCDGDEAVGVSMADTVDDEWRDATRREMARGCEVAVQFESKLKRKDGSAVWVLVDTAPTFGESGNSEGVLAMVMDVTGRKKAEEALKVAEEVSRSLERQLRHAQKMEAVGRLAGGIAHDFNNVLSVVLSYAEMVLGDLKAGDPLRDDIQEIHKAGTRAAGLTQQLLMFSRQQVIAPKVLDLNEVLSGMGKMLQRLVREDVELISIAGTSLGRVRVDPGSMEQIIMNLAVNARDAMPTGGKLTIETANVALDEEYAKSHFGARAGPYVMLSASDTGGGMDAATQARIFEPFFTTKEMGKGTGLGLSTVFGIVQQSGGHLWVCSEPGMGATFKVYLPRVEETAEELRPSREATTLRGYETILLVEDEQQVRDVARGILRRHGYTVIEACGAAEAVLSCGQHVGPIHLLLTDVVMPGMNGPELAKRLVRDRPGMRVLCMSGYADDADVRNGVIETDLAYLQKPLTVGALTRKVRDVLDSKAGLPLAS